MAKGAAGAEAGPEAAEGNEAPNVDLKPSKAAILAAIETLDATIEAKSSQLASLIQTQENAAARCVSRILDSIWATGFFWRGHPADADRE